MAEGRRGAKALGKGRGKGRGSERGKADVLATFWAAISCVLHLQAWLQKVARAEVQGRARLLLQAASSPSSASSPSNASSPSIPCDLQLLGRRR